MNGATWALSTRLISGPCDIQASSIWIGGEKGKKQVQGEARI